LEKIIRVSARTSNWPLRPGFIATLSPKRDSSEAARLAARGL
jgi:hypothetical protein